MFTDDGWFKSGDLGVIDADGFLYIKGRLKNMILGPSGKNIYPEELETIINEFDSVRESIVFEQQNDWWLWSTSTTRSSQQLVHSFGEVDIRGKVKSILDDLHKQVNERVPFHARIHRVVEHLEPFQKTPTQKIKRHLYVS